MKKFLATLATSLLLVTGFTVQPAFAACSMTGAGTQANPWIVLTPANLSKVGVVEAGGCLTTYNQDQYYKLGADIELSGNFTPITISGSSLNGGGFDGDNRTISGLNVNIAGQQAGLFSSLSYARVMNLTVLGSSVSGSSYVGALAGNVSDSNLTNIKVFMSGNVSGAQIVGGAIGNSVDTFIQDLTYISKEGEVRGSDYVGGAIGSAQNSTVQHVSAKTDVSATGITGGLVGEIIIESDITFSQLVYEGRLTGDQFVGGLIGYAWSIPTNKSFAVVNSSTTGSVSTLSSADVPAAFIGNIGNSDLTVSVSNSYASAIFSSGGSVRASTTSVNTSGITPTYSHNFYEAWAQGSPTLTGATLSTNLASDALSVGSTWTVIQKSSYSSSTGPENWVIDTSQTPYNSGKPMTASAYNLGFYNPPCVAGTYSSTGIQPCVNAPLGRYIPNSGATFALPCEAGTYQSQAGQISCISSPAGSYVADTGSIAPLPCPAGYTSALGATSCTPPASAGGGGGGGGSSAPTIPTVTSNPSLTGTVATGQMIVADNGAWKADWPLNYSYKWLRCDKPVTAGSAIPAEAACVEIPTEIGKWYVITPADLKKFITVEITASDETNKGVFVAGSVNAKGLKYLAFGKKPTITGKAKVGKTLSVGKLTWASAKPTKTTYQWYRCTTPVASGAAIASDCKAISGAKKSSYKQTTSDKKKYISVKIGAALGSEKVSSSAGLAAKTS